MKKSIVNIAICALIAAAPGFRVEAGTTTPSRVSSSQLSELAYYTSGLIFNSSFRGSGTVVANPKVVVSCAHVVYNNGQWLQPNRWNRAWHSAGSPSGATSTQDFRGNWHWTAYAGGTANSGFIRDFVAHYAYANLANGAYSGYTSNDTVNQNALGGPGNKMIIGYPGADGYYMNSVGPFTSAYASKESFFIWNTYVKGGGGMSGGGVFAWTAGEWRLAAVHVAGPTNGGMGAGARALDSAALSLIASAATSANPVPPAVTTRSFSSTTRVSIPDASSAWTVVNLPVSSMPAAITAITVSLNVTHTFKGDLEITLTSPTGRVLSLHSRAGGSADNVILTNLDAGSSFNGTNPNGSWKVSMRDLAAGDTGTFNSASLVISSR